MRLLRHARIADVKVKLRAANLASGQLDNVAAALVRLAEQSRRTVRYMAVLARSMRRVAELERQAERIRLWPIRPDCKRYRPTGTPRDWR